MTPTFFFTDLLVSLVPAHTQNFSLLGSLEVVNYTFPDGGGGGGLELRIMLLSPAVLGLGLSLAKSPMDPLRFK